MGQHLYSLFPLRGYKYINEYHSERIFRQAVTAETWWWRAASLSAPSTSILSLINLLSGGRHTQVQQHKGNWTVCISSKQKAHKVICLTWSNPHHSSTDCKAASMSLGHTFQMLQFHHTVTGQSWPGSCSIKRNFLRIWKKRQVVWIANDSYAFRKKKYGKNSFFNLASVKSKAEEVLQLDAHLRPDSSRPCLAALGEY